MTKAAVDVAIAAIDNSHADNDVWWSESTTMAAEITRT
jgi:hypothetical protein